MSSYILNNFFVISGGPQEFHLDSFLIVLFFNGLHSIFDCSVDTLLFADNAKIFLNIKSPNDGFVSLNDKFVG